MPHFYREAKKHLARERWRLSKMVKGSNNYQKQKIKVARAYEIVRNWKHKGSTHLADKHDVIVVDIAQSLRRSKNMNDNAFGQFRTFLAYARIRI